MCQQVGPSIMQGRSRIDALAERPNASSRSENALGAVRHHGSLSVDWKPVIRTATGAFSAPERRQYSEVAISKAMISLRARPRALDADA